MKTSRYDTKLQEAISDAANFADTNWMPQTVFRTGDTCGWAHTHPFSPVLAKPGTEVFLTILNKNYFN